MTEGVFLMRYLIEMKEPRTVKSLILLDSLGFRHCSLTLKKSQINWCHYLNGAMKILALQELLSILIYRREGAQEREISHLIFPMKILIWLCLLPLELEELQTALAEGLYHPVRHRKAEYQHLLIVSCSSFKCALDFLSSIKFVLSADRTTGADSCKHLQFYQREVLISFDNLSLDTCRVFPYYYIGKLCTNIFKSAFYCIFLLLPKWFFS